MPEASSPEQGGAELKPTALAEALEDLSDRLAEVLPGTSDERVRAVLSESLAGLRRVSSGIRALALMLDPARAQELAQREGDLKSLVTTIGQSIRNVANANREVATAMADQVRELDDLTKLPPGDELAARLRSTVVRVRETASAMDSNLGALVTKIDSANQRIALLEQQLNEARQKALRDALTLVYSRAALNEQLLAALRDGESKGPWCCLIADIDHFKEVNDRHGHIVGDALLYKIARIMEDTLKKRASGAFLARYGGEEFCVLLPGSTVEKGKQIADLIRAAIEAARWQSRTGSGDAVIRATVSLGVAQYRGGDTTASLVDRADRGLYRAKEEGRNRVAVAGN
jgi:diguanylate cyclase